MGKEMLGEFELLVLLAALRLGEDAAYAVAIADEIEARTGRAAQRSAVYVTLQRLEERRLLTSRLGSPSPERGGKARRLVRVEPAGIAAVAATRAAFQNMWRGLSPALGDGR